MKLLQQHFSSRKGEQAVRSGVPRRIWLLKRVWTHSFQVHETAFFFAEQIKMEKQMGMQLRDVGVLFPKAVSQGPVWFVGAT